MASENNNNVSIIALNQLCKLKYSHIDDRLAFVLHKGIFHIETAEDCSSFI